MTDIVERLRKFEFLSTVGKENPNLYRDAADEIERLREALKPFADYYRVPTFEEQRAAKAALEEK